MFNDGRDAMMQHMRRRSNGSSITSDDTFMKGEEALAKSTHDNEAVDDDERFNNEADTRLNGGSMRRDNESVNEKISAQDEKEKWRKIYALHFLFMWNTRTYEFASVSYNMP